MNTLVLTPEITLHPEDINDPLRAAFILQHDEILDLSKPGLRVWRLYGSHTDGWAARGDGVCGGFTLSRLVKWLEALADEREAEPSPPVGTGGDGRGRRRGVGTRGEVGSKII